MGSTSARTLHRSTGIDADDGSILSRVTRVMGAYAATNAHEMSLAELARHTGIPKPSLHRLLKQMVDRRLLERTEEGRYQYGMALFELGRMVPVQHRLREIALPYMQDLYVATHETVHLGIPSGLEVVYVERITGHRATAVPTEVGGRMPMYCTGLGKAILAFSEESVIESALSAGLEPLSPHTIRFPGRIREELRRIRIEQVAYDREEAVQGIVCIAAPIISDGAPVAAISVTGPKIRFRPERFARAMRSTAEAIAISYEATLARS